MLVFSDVGLGSSKDSNELGQRIGLAVLVSSD